MPLKSVFVATFILIAGFVAAADTPIRVLVWDEQQPAQKGAYPSFLGNQIAQHLKDEGMKVTSVRLDDDEQGLTKENLDNTDVIIWWGHIRQTVVSVEKSKDIVERIKAGKLGLITLHSAHFSEPFIQAMRAKTIEDALKKLSDNERKTVKIKTDDPKRINVKKDTPLTPTTELKTEADGTKTLEIKFPLCIFPAWRGDGLPSHVTTLKPDHPIAKGIPSTWDISKTEMYDEPFHVPAPDELVFEEKWDKGEHFRSGMVWNLGKGKVFYFRPGHETFGVYREELPLKVLTNAVRWMGERK